MKVALVSSFKVLIFEGDEFVFFVEFVEIVHIKLDYKLKDT